LGVPHQTGWTIVVGSFIAAILITFRRKIYRAAERSPRASITVNVGLVIGILAYLWIWQPDFLLDWILQYVRLAYLDLLVYVIVGLAGGYLSYLGGRLATTDKTLRRRFDICGVVFALAVIVAGIRQFQMAADQDHHNEELAHRLDAIGQKAWLWFNIMPTKVPDSTGHVTVPFEIGNISNLDPGQVTIYVSLDVAWCRFDSNNPRWQYNTDKASTIVLPLIDTLDKPIAVQPGTHTGIYTVKIIVPPHLSPCRVYFYYSCQQCKRESTDRKSWYSVDFPPYLDLKP
jgi:hypothetical protein